MIDRERIEELIKFQKTYRQSFRMFSGMFGGIAGPMMDSVAGATVTMIDDTIQALEELKEIRGIKKLIDG